MVECRGSRKRAAMANAMTTMITLEASLASAAIRMSRDKLHLQMQLPHRFCQSGGRMTEGAGAY